MIDKINFENYKVLAPIETILDSVGKIKIINLLAIEGELNVTAITRKTGLNHSRVKQYLNELIVKKIVIEKCFGRIRIFSIDKEEYAGYKLIEFFTSWDKFSKSNEK